MIEIDWESMDHTSESTDHSYHITYGILSFLTGSAILCLFSTIQKMLIGSPLTLKAYTVPFWFGGFTGLIIGTWYIKLKVYAAELEKANEELKSLDRMKNDFLSNISHELKTPLISIKGFSELLNDGNLGLLNEQQNMAIDKVIRNSERLGQLIDSILYMSMKQAGKIEYVLNPVNVVEIINNTVSDMFPQIDKKGLTIEQDVADDLPTINGDMDKLKQVLFNLIDNAIKFTPQGGTITVAAREEDDNLHIMVSDTGIGITKNIASNLFHRFYQADTSTTRKYGGTGVGLYITKLIVDAHDGRIWVESKEGVGSTFHVVLPK